MFTVLLICSDEVCDHAEEFVGEFEAADAMLCEGCGCLMQVVGVEGSSRPAAVVDLAARRKRRSGATAGTLAA